MWRLRCHMLYNCAYVCYDSYVCYEYYQRTWKHIEMSCQNIKGKDMHEFLYDDRIKGYTASYPITANRIQLCLKIFYFLLKFKNYVIICISLCSGLIINEIHDFVKMASRWLHIYIYR